MSLHRCRRSSRHTGTQLCKSKLAAHPVLAAVQTLNSAVGAVRSSQVLIVQQLCLCKAQKLSHSAMSALACRGTMGSFTTFEATDCILMQKHVWRLSPTTVSNACLHLVCLRSVDCLG